MARWKLTQKHYLNIPNCEWEYSETDAQAGTINRKRFPVPKFLDPDSPRDWTDKNLGEIVVCHEGKGARGDQVFVGPPTPDMEPLDDEAVEISNALKARWAHPIDSLPVTGDYSQSLIKTFEKQLNEIVAGVRQMIPATSVPSVTNDQFEELKRQIAELTEKNTQLQAKVEGIRRV